MKEKVKEKVLKLRLGLGRVILGISYLGLGLSILSLGDSTLDCESSIGTFSLRQGLNLLTFTLVLGLRTILANLLAFGHLSPLALVTDLSRTFGDFRRR